MARSLRHMKQRNLPELKDGPLVVRLANQMGNNDLSTLCSNPAINTQIEVDCKRWKMLPHMPPHDVGKLSKQFQKQGTPTEAVVVTESFRYEQDKIRLRIPGFSIIEGDHGERRRLFIFSGHACEVRTRCPNSESLTCSLYIYR